MKIVKIVHIATWMALGFIAKKPSHISGHLRDLWIVKTFFALESTHFPIGAHWRNPEMISIAVIIICIGLGAYLGYRDWAEWDFALLGALMGFVISILLVVAITVIVDVTAIHDCYEIQAKELVSLDRGTNISGQFILGTGEIEGKPCYFGYVKNEDGGFQLRSLLAENTTIFEKPISKGVLHIYQPRIPVFNAFSIFTLEKYRERYVLEIPEGSIIREFRP